ncbi:hypothetical protein ACFL0D_05310 [Thermoproteota archaeon]
MNNIEKELEKILKDRCPVINLKSMLDSTDKSDLNPDLLLESIDILKMHEEEIRGFRQSLELLLQDKVIKRYIARKINEKNTHIED